MADILKSLPFLSIEDYLWKYSSSFIKLMAYDRSRIKYLKDKKEKKAQNAYTADEVLSCLGLGAGKVPTTNKEAEIPFMQKLRGNNIIRNNVKP